MLNDAISGIWMALWEATGISRGSVDPTVHLQKYLGSHCSIGNLMTAQVNMHAQIRTVAHVLYTKVLTYLGT